jgi:A/G-specific adenine glycosylase
MREALRGRDRTSDHAAMALVSPPRRLPPARHLPTLRRALLAWHRKHGLRAPWRASGDAYQVLVAAVMAQQTQMSRVLLKFDEFIAAFPTADALARAPAADVLRRWELLGYNLRALRLHRAAKLIVRKGGFPRAAAELERIEGIGPFTAAIVASFAFGEPAPAIDTNVRRVLARLLGDASAQLPERALLPAAERLMSRRAPARWNQAMMDLGALVCTSRSPKCDVCPLARWCRARSLFAKGTRRVAEGRVHYDGSDRLKPVPQKEREPPFHGSRRYYRGLIVQALRELPPGASLSPSELSERLPGRDGLDETELAELIASLQRDGLVRTGRGGRLRLP